LRCPVCGSTRLAWDELTGYLVCQDCGAVISQLIEEERPALPRPPWRPIRRRPEPVVPPASRPLEEDVEEAAAKAVRRGKVIEVVGRAVRLRPPMKEKVEGLEGLLEMMSGFPDLKSRTERVRKALALYAALRAMGFSRSRATELASRAAGASPRSILKVRERHQRSLAMYEVAVAEALRQKRLSPPMLAEKLKAGLGPSVHS